MPEVLPFEGFRYNPNKTGALDDVVTPPYDVISPEERSALAAQSPYNLVHLILPEADGASSKYAAARQALDAWINEGVLAQDDAPSYYLLQQRFTDLDGNPRVRRGFFAVVKLPEEGEQTILGHERTFDKPVEDRLELTRATEANLGPVFGLYPDPDQTIGSFLNTMDERPPDATAKTIDGVEQDLWRVPASEAVAECFKNKTIYIADGHHRFKTACAYRDEQRRTNPNAGPQPYDYVLMGLVALEDPGLAIYPPHRLVDAAEGFDANAFLDKLKTWFEVSPVNNSLPARVEAAPVGCVMGLVIHGHGEYLLRLEDIDRTELLGSDRGPAWRDLDVAVLHRGIIEGVLGIAEGTQFTYVKNAAEAVEAADGGKNDLAFILRATRPEQIRACAEAGEPMPQKATYFFPKLPSGAVIYRLR